MNLETLERIARIERSFQEMQNLSDACGPIVKRYIGLRMNLLLSGWNQDKEPVTLTLHKREWPNVERYGYDRTDRVIGFNIAWVE